MIVKQIFNLQNRGPESRPHSMQWSSPKRGARKVFGLENCCQEEVSISGNQPSRVGNKTFIDIMKSSNSQIPADFGLQMSSHERK